MAAIEDQQDKTWLERKNDKDCIACNCCGNFNAKYRCPRCDVMSCSLNCVKSHKLKSDCTGRRKKTEFVTKTEYNERNLLNDYRFLEEANRVADNAFRDHKNKLKLLSRNAKLLRSKAAQSGIRLKLMPVGFTKRRENTSFYHYRSKVIRWRLKWVFPQASTEYIDARVSEKEKIETLMKKYIDPIEADPVYKQKLKAYYAVDPNGICVFLQDHSTSQTRFFKIDTSKTLEDTLKNKVIIEYPSFHVVLPRHAMEFPETVASPDAKRLRLHDDDLSTTGKATSENDMSMTSGSLENNEIEIKPEEILIKNSAGLT